MGNGSLESLSKSGIIDFDADAYIKNGVSKPVETESSYLPFDKPLVPIASPYGITPGEQLKGEPSKDAFVSHKEKEHSKSNWKQILGGIIAGGIATFGGFKLFKKLNNPLKIKASAKKEGLFTIIKEKLVSVLQPEEEIKKTKKTKKAKKTVGKTAKDTVKETTEKGAKKTAEKTVKEVAEKGKGILAKIPKGLKIAGGILIGLLGLYGFYEVAFKKHNNTESNKKSE